MSVFNPPLNFKRLAEDFSPRQAGGQTGERLPETAVVSGRRPRTRRGGRSAAERTGSEDLDNWLGSLHLIYVVVEFIQRTDSLTLKMTD